MTNNITRTYARQIEKARIPLDVAEILVDCVYSPATVFASIDRIFMKAKFSGLTSSEIIAVMESGAFAEDLMDEKKLIALKPYLKIWPKDPRKAKLAFDAGMSPAEITKIGAENISEESLKVMISLN